MKKDNFLRFEVGKRDHLLSFENTKEYRLFFNF